MVNETHVSRLVAQFDSGNTRAEFERLMQEISQASRHIVSGDLVSETQLSRLSQQLRQAIAEGARGSNIFKDLPAQFRESIVGATGTSGKFLAEQATLFSRTIDLAMAKAGERAANNPSGTARIMASDLGLAGRQSYGTVRAFAEDASDVQRRRAQLDAANRLSQRTAAYDRAARGLESAIDKEVEAHNKAADAAIRAARAEQEALARSINKINQRTDADRQEYLRDFAANARLQQRLGYRFSAGEDFLLGQRDRQVALQSVSYPGATGDTGIGRAKGAVNRAETALYLADENLRKTRASQKASAEQVIAAEQKYRNAVANLASAQHRLSVRSATAPPTPSGFFAQFREGFRGGQDVPYAQQVGQAAKFSVLYGAAYKALFMFTQTMQQTLQEGIDFQTAVSELKLATGRSAESASELANQLGHIAANAGFSASEGALAGARAVGLYGATQGSEATQNAIARLSTDVNSKLAFNSGMQIADVQTTLAAITNAFQLGYAGQSRVADMDAYFSKKFGVAPGQGIQTVAESGSVAQQAGFSLEQTAAIAALLQGRTGQTSSAVAGWMAQIFSRGGEGSLTAVTGRYGIDTNETLAAQLAQLAEIYKTASPNEQNEIAAAFGRGKVQNAISVLLGSFDDVSKAANEAASGMADGAADKAFDERVNNIGGEIQLLLADLKEFANQLGQSGVLAGLGAVIVVFDELVTSTTSLLELWNEMNPALRAFLATLAVGAAVNKFTGGAAGLSLLSRAGIAPYSDLATGRTVYGGRTGAGGAARGMAAGAGAAVLSAGPWIAATASLYAIGEMHGAVRDFSDAMKAAQDALNASTEDLVTPDQLRASADDLRNSASKDDIKGPWANLVNLNSKIPDLLGLGPSMSDVEGKSDARLEEEADFRERLAKIREAELGTSASSAGLTPLIDDLSSSGISKALESMGAKGMSAAEQLRVLEQSISGTGEVAERTAKSLNVSLLAGDTALGLGNLGVDKEGLSSSLKRNLKDQGITDFRQLKGKGIADAGPIAGMFGVDGFYQVSDAANKVAAATVDDMIAINPLLAEHRKELIRSIATSLGMQADDAISALKRNKELTDEQLTAVLGAEIPLMQAQVDALPETDLDGRMAGYRGMLRRIRRRVNRQHGGAWTDGATQQFNQIEKALVDVQIDRLERLRIAAQQEVQGDAGATKRVGVSFFRREAAIAIKAGDAGADRLVALVEQAGAWGRNAIEQMIRNLMAKIREAGQRLAAIYQSVPTDFIGPVPTENSYKNLQTYKDLQDQIKIVKNTPHGDNENDPFLTGSDVPGYEAPAAGKNPAKSAADKKADADARRQKMLSIRSSLRLLAIDLSNPLAEARVAVQDALDQVKHAMDRESRLAARVDLRRARIDLEAQKFQQRLETVQTAEELGRISHLKYIHYLDSERSRLESIKKRTYQQQQQLDEVERLLKSAGEEIEGQWNFGDIRLPTPYEVRRRVEDVYGSLNPARTGIGKINLPRDAGRVTNNNVRIEINGADVAMVKRTIREYAGDQLTTRNHRPRHR